MTKKSKPPTQSQLKVIADFEYPGVEPTTIGEASLIIKKCLDGEFPRKIKSISQSSVKAPSSVAEDNMQQHTIPPEMKMAAIKYANEYSAHTSSPKVIESNIQLLWKFWCNLPAEKRFTDDGYYIYGAFLDVCPDFPSLLKVYTKWLNERHLYITDNKAAVLSPQSQQFRQFLCNRFTDTGFSKPMVYYLDEWLSEGMPPAIPVVQEMVADKLNPTYPNLRRYWENDPWLKHRFELFYDFLNEYEDFAALERMKEKDMDNTSHPVFEKFLKELREEEI